MQIRRAANCTAQRQNIMQQAATEQPRFSLIIPVYNRPDEVDELLENLAAQTRRDFEVIVVEDGSTTTCEDVVQRHAPHLPSVRYLSKENGGPGPARNFGAEQARGKYYIVLDSDCVLPPTYIEAIEQELDADACDAWGGPDRAHPLFTPVQKAINYSMTSFFTTGGIRGGRRKLDKFYPRSFNMGISAELWKQLGGFAKMRFGEDIDFSIRIYKSGARCRLMPEAWVWHKRRTDLRKFFKQVHNSGLARVNLYIKYPESLKLVHLLPTVFTIGVAALLVLAACGLWIALLPIALYVLLIFIDASWQNHSIKVGLLAVPASFVQLCGYGTGFLRGWWLRIICGRRDEVQAFQQTFYK